MTYEEYLKILKVMNADAETIPWGSCVPYDEQDRENMPRLTPEERVKWNNLKDADNFFKKAEIYRIKLKKQASGYLEYKNQQLTKEGKKPITKEDYLDKGGFLDDKEFLSTPVLDKIPREAPFGDYSYEDIKRRAEKMKSAYIKHKGADDLIDRKEAIKDDYWINYGNPTVSEEQVYKLRQRVQKLADKGVDFDEYFSSGYEKEYIEKNKCKTNPLQFATLCNMGPRAEETAKCYDKEYYDDAMGILNDIETKLDASIKAGEKEFDGPDISGVKLSIWFNTEVFEDINSLAMLDSALGNKEKENLSPEKRLSVFETVTGLDPEKMDPDKAKNFDLETLKEASDLYKKNKKALDNLFHDMFTHRHGRGYLEDRKRMEKLKDEEPGLYKTANRFRHLLHKIKQQNERNIKLGNDEKPVFVEPISADVDFTDANVRNKELQILDTCYEMLEEPSRRVQKNSNEYQKVMRSIHNMQKSLMASGGNPKEAREEYVRGMEKVMTNIKQYYLHKARKGVANDATLEKLMAIKRVEKHLQARYKTLEKEDYEKRLEVVPDLFKTEPDRKKSGDDYVLDLAMGEIGNMRKEMSKIKQEDLEKIQRRNSVGGPTVKNKLEELGNKEPEKAGPGPSIK